jgi:hypothetical protein
MFTVRPAVTLADHGQAHAIRDMRTPAAQWFGY